MILDKEIYDRVKESTRFNYDEQIYLTDDKVRDIILDLIYELSITKLKCKKLEDDLFRGGTNFKEEKCDREE